MNKDNVLKGIVYGIPLIIALFVLPVLIYTFYTNNFDLSRKASTQSQAVPNNETNQNQMTNISNPTESPDFIPCNNSIYPKCSEGKCPENYRCELYKDSYETTCECKRFK